MGGKAPVMMRGMTNARQAACRECLAEEPCQGFDAVVPGKGDEGELERLAGPHERDEPLQGIAHCPCPDAGDVKRYRQRG